MISFKTFEEFEALQEELLKTANKFNLNPREGLGQLFYIHNWYPEDLVSQLCYKLEFKSDTIFEVRYRNCSKNVFLSIKKEGHDKIELIISVPRTSQMTVQYNNKYYYFHSDENGKFVERSTKKLVDLL